MNLKRHTGTRCRTRTSGSSRGARQGRALLLLALALSFATLLLRYPPSVYSFYPQCPIYAWSHILCPGCGATRAFAALLRGHLTEAARNNVLIVAVVPVVAVYAAIVCKRAWQGREVRWPQPPNWAVATVLAVAAIFTVARNLPR